MTLAEIQAKLHKAALGLLRPSPEDWQELEQGLATTNEMRPPSEDDWRRLEDELAEINDDKSKEDE